MDPDETAHYSGSTVFADSAIVVFGALQVKKILMKPK